MSYAQPPMFLGFFEITTGVNDRLDWYEEDGLGNNATLSITMSSGEYYIGDDATPGTLLGDLKVAMEAASDAGAIGVAHGAGLDYSLSLDPSTGLISITASNYTAPKWYPKITLAEVNQLLTGVDIPGGSGEAGENGLGWLTQSSYPSAAETQTADEQPKRTFFPDQPPETYNPNRMESESIEAVSLSGAPYSMDFSGDSDNLRVYELSFNVLNETSKDDYLDFWLKHGKQGSPDGRFQFYEDRTQNTDPVVCVLTGESLGLVDCPRVGGYPLYSLTIYMRHYV